MWNKAVSASLAGLVLATGCSTAESRAARERNPAPCPNVVVLADAARLVDFAGEPSVETVAWSAEIEDVQLSCRYFADKPIEASLDVKLAFGRGPAAAEETHQYQYFVAVTRTNSEVIAKEVFPVAVDFGDDRAVRRVSEEIDEIIIPRAGDKTSGTNFEVIVGLVLTPEQAIYNRSGQSLKFPEL